MAVSFGWPFLRFKVKLFVEVGDNEIQTRI